MVVADTPGAIVARTVIAAAVRPLRESCDVSLIPKADKKALRAARREQAKRAGTLNQYRSVRIPNKKRVMNKDACRKRKDIDFEEE